MSFELASFPSTQERFLYTIFAHTDYQKYVKSVCILGHIFVLIQWAPLHTAAEKGRFENTLKYLVHKGADISIRDNDGVIVMSLHFNKELGTAV